MRRLVNFRFQEISRYIERQFTVIEVKWLGKLKLSFRGATFREQELRKLSERKQFFT